MTVEAVSGVVAALCAAGALACSVMWRKETANRSAISEKYGIAQAFADLVEDARTHDDRVIGDNSSRIEVRDITVRVAPEHGESILRLQERVRRLREHPGKTGAPGVERLEDYANKAIIAAAKWAERNTLVNATSEDTFERRQALRDAFRLSGEAVEARRVLNGE